MPYDASAELDRQVRTLLDKGYPAAAGLSCDDLADLLEPLRAGVVRRRAGMAPPTGDRVPFVLVVTRKLVPAEESVPRTKLRTRPGAISRHLADLDRFVAIESLDLPAPDAYVILDVERGAEFCDLPPDDALPAVAGRGRTPLTVDEGIALVTHFPATLEKNRCWSLAGSRCGDRRVPAMWISKAAPMLGWCWSGTPHGWLGLASCGARLGAGQA